MYSAAQDKSRSRIDDPSGVSLHTCMSSGVAGILSVSLRHSFMASSVFSQSPSTPSLWPRFQRPTKDSYDGTLDSSAINTPVYR